MWWSWGVMRAMVGVCAFGFLLSACQTVRPLPPGMYYSHQEYKTFDGYKAMMGAIGARGAWTFGWSWGYVSVDSAIENATKSCKKNLTKYGVLADCKLHFIGDTNVRGWTDEKISAAVADYKSTVRSGGVEDTVASRLAKLSSEGQADVDDWKRANKQSALAISFSGAYGIGYDFSNLVGGAQKRALDGCGKHATDCLLVGENGVLFTEFGEETIAGSSLATALSAKAELERKAKVHQRASDRVVCLRAITFLFDPPYQWEDDVNIAHWVEEAQARGFSVADCSVVADDESNQAKTSRAPSTQAVDEDLRQKLTQIKALLDADLITEDEAADKRNALLSEY